MEVPETLEIEKIEEEHEIKINDDKIRIEMNNDEIIFCVYIDLSFNKYIKRFAHDVFRKKYEISEEKNIKELYNDIINYEYEINEKEKKLIFGYKKEIK